MSYLENSGDSLMLSINEIYLNKKQIISYSLMPKNYTMNNTVMI